MKRIRLTGSFLLLILTAYSCQASGKDVEKELKTITSWAATAHMVVEAWMQDSVPRVYAKHTLEKTQHELANEREVIVRQFAQQTPRLPEQLQRLDQTIHQLAIAVDHKDKQAATQPLQQLDAIQHQIEMLSQKVDQS